MAGRLGKRKSLDSTPYLDMIHSLITSASSPICNDMSWNLGNYLGKTVLTPETATEKLPK